MTEYIDGLDRATYMFAKDGRVFSPKNDDSKKIVAAFLGVVKQADELSCIVDEQVRGSVHNAKIKHIDTFAEATLSINYGGLHGYHAKVTLGNGQQVAVDGGSDTAIRRIVNYLKIPKPVEKKTPTRKVPVVTNDMVGAESHPHDQYAHLEQKFEE